MRRTALVIGSVMAALVLGGSTVAAEDRPEPRAGSTSPADYAFLEAQVFTAPGLGAVAVGMPTDQVVKVQTRRADGTWTRPRVLFRKPGVTCGAIDGRASAGGVALIVECDTPYYEDQAPVDSRALVTQDLTTWATHRLDGEAYQDPAISADGSHAAWLFGGHGQYLLFSAGSGFSTGQTSFDYDSGGETVVVDDAGTVTVMGPDGNGHGCELGVWDRSLTGPEDHYVIAGVDPGCTEGGVDNVDDRTVVGAGTREQRFVVTRQSGARWVLSRPAPLDAPGLVVYRGAYKRLIPNVYSDAEGLPLVSVGSPDRQHVTVQAYDDAAGTWGATRTVFDRGFPGCTAAGSYPYEPRPRLHAVELHCYARPRADGDYPPFVRYGPAPPGKVRLLTSSNGADWTLTNLGGSPYGLAADGALLAAPGLDATTVLSTGGTVSLPVTAPGRCDFVFPIGPTSVLRLHGRKNAAWPTRLQRSDDGGAWRTIQTVRMPATGTCRRTRALHDEPPSLFFLRGGHHSVSLVVRRGGEGGWHVERFSY